MWFSKRKTKPDPSKWEIIHHETMSRRGDRQLDYLKIKLDKPIPPAKDGIEVFYGKKKK